MTSPSLKKVVAKNNKGPLVEPQRGDGKRHRLLTRGLKVIELLLVILSEKVINQFELYGRFLSTFSGYSAISSLIAIT